MLCSFYCTLQLQWQSSSRSCLWDAACALRWMDQDRVGHVWCKIGENWCAKLTAADLSVTLRSSNCRMFSICSPRIKGDLVRSHRAHGSLRGRSSRPIMASGTERLRWSAARSPLGRIDIRPRGRSASVPMGPGSASGGSFERSAHAGSSSLVHAKVVPSRHILLRITAILRAAATVAFFSPFFSASFTARAFSGEKRGTRWIRMLAAS